MFVSSQGINLIKKFEGFKPVVYSCVGGHNTIGYGHKLSKEEKYSIIDINFAEKLLVKDLCRICCLINKITYSDLCQHQYDALTSLVFNIGVGAYQRSTLRSKINRGEHYDAGNEFRKWVYIGHKKSRGLVLRRYVESNLYLMKY